MSVTATNVGCNTLLFLLCCLLSLACASVGCAGSVCGTCSGQFWCFGFGRLLSCFRVHVLVLALPVLLCLRAACLHLWPSSCCPSICLSPSSLGSYQFSFSILAGPFYPECLSSFCAFPRLGVPAAASFAAASCGRCSRCWSSSSCPGFLIPLWILFSRTCFWPR